MTARSVGTYRGSPALVSAAATCAASSATVTARSADEQARSAGQAGRHSARRRGRETAPPPRPRTRRDGDQRIDDPQSRDEPACADPDPDAAGRAQRHPPTIPMFCGSGPGKNRRDGGRRASTRRAFVTIRARTWPGRPGPCAGPGRPLEARQGNERKLRPVRRLLVSTRRRKRLAGRPWSRSIGPFRVSARPAETASFTHKNRRRASRGQ